MTFGTRFEMGRQMYFRRLVVWFPDSGHPQVSRSALAMYKPLEIMLIDNKLTERGKTERKIHLLRWYQVFLFRGSFFFLRLLIYLFLEGKRGRETSLCGCVLRTLYWVPGLQLRHVP